MDEGTPSFEALNGLRRRNTKLGGADDLLHSHFAARIIVGGSTCGSRFNEGCKRCSWGDDSPRHRYYECPHNSSAEANEGKDITSTNWLFKKAEAAAFKPRCLWFRGVLPASMEKQLAGVDSDTQNHRRRWAAGKFNFEGAAYTDGSGGPKWVHPSVRKAGSAAALLQWRQDDLGD